MSEGGESLSLYDAIKQIVQTTLQNSKPAVFLFGTVTREEPLQIFVDNRFYLEGEALVVPLTLQKKAMDTHYHGLLTHSAEPDRPIESLQNGVYATDSGSKGNEKEMYYGLKAGEKVVLLRNQGGQQFLVLERV